MLIQELTLQDRIKYSRGVTLTLINHQLIHLSALGK